MLLHYGSLALDLQLDKLHSQVLILSIHTHDYGCSLSYAKLIEIFFFNRILLLNMKSVTFPVLHKTLKTFLHLHTSLKT